MAYDCQQIGARIELRLRCIARRPQFLVCALLVGDLLKNAKIANQAFPGALILKRCNPADPLCSSFAFGSHDDRFKAEVFFALNEISNGPIEFFALFFDHDFRQAGQWYRHIVQTDIVSNP
ncbi:hypothetical protein [uncultured Erythrobacter sp.]|uniref:hypothetical protein n=1 Tax=uncultured Erythrobacter sp. TaxID=263913 RepID=UPI002613FD2E|nr:hypothetical protein [uncultured Erythrobacter sp.]